MAFTNNVMIVRHKLLENLVALWKENQLVEKIDRIPLEISPRRSQPVGRCCIHKERAVTKYKLLPLLGWDMTDESIGTQGKNQGKYSLCHRRSMFFLCTGELRSK